MSEQTLDDFGLPVDNAGKDEKPAPRKTTNARGRKKSKVEQSKEFRNASPFAANVGKYSKVDAAKDDWDELEEYTPGTLPNLKKLQDEYPEYTFRFIRTMRGGAPDTERVYEAANQGWEPFFVENLPAGMVVPGFDMEGVGHVVGLSGLMLCFMPTTRYNKLKAGEREEAVSQISNIGSEIREVNSGGGVAPLKTTRSSTRRGVRVQG